MTTTPDPLIVSGKARGQDRPAEPTRLTKSPGAHRSRSPPRYRPPTWPRAALRSRSQGEMLANLSTGLRSPSNP